MSVATISNAGTTVNLSIVQRTTFKLSCSLTDSGGSPINLTGATIIATIKYASPLSFTTTVTDAASGSFDLSLSAAQTAQLVTTPALWECRITYPDGRVDELIRGAVTGLEGLAP